MSIGSSSGSGDSQSKSYTPKQEEYMGKALDIYGKTIGVNAPSKIYQENRVAPITGTQKSILDTLGSTMDTEQIRSSMPLYGETGSALSGILSGSTGATELSTEQANNAFNQSRVNPAFNTFNRTTAPLLREEYAGPGYWGSARANAVAEQGTELNKSLEAERANYLWNVENANRSIQEAKAGRALSAAPVAMQYDQQATAEQANRISNSTNAYNLAAQGQVQAQNEINAAMQKFAEQNQITNADDLTVLLSLLGMNYSSGSSKSSSSGFSFGL